MNRILSLNPISSTRIRYTIAASFAFIFTLATVSRAQEITLGLTHSFAEDEPVVTHHQMTLHGKPVSYTARTGYLAIRDEEQVTHARMFYTSYTLDDAAKSSPRPLLFAWNGGPGSNASLLELAGLGPKRINKDPGPSNPRHPSPLVDNEDTWLQFADLIFVDPINTGYSYATTPDTLKEFLNDRGDADSVAEFIRLYRQHYNLQLTPLFLMGESYGTFRAAGVADVLAKRKIPLDGVILLSTVLNLHGDHDSDLSSVFLIPNYTATAWVHHRLAPELEKNLAQTVDEAQHWAESEYLAALTQGNRLPDDRKKAIAQKLARYTGIPAATWEAADLKLDPDTFASNVLGPEKLEYAAHYDTSMIGKLSHPGAPYNVDADPSLDNGVEAIVGSYLRDELGFKTDAFHAGPFGGGYPSPTSFRADWASVRWNRGSEPEDRSEALADAIHKTPALRIFIAHGYYDLSTPFASTEYTLSHMDVSPADRQRITLVRYEGGHAAYINPQVRAQFSKDVQTFVTASTPTN
jgi:carboxypeptidase C (cathepsin A)